MLSIKNFGIIALLFLPLAAANLNAQDNVSEDVPEDDSDVVAPVQTDDAALLSEFERYKQYMNDGTLDEAESVAKRVVELAIRTKGPQSSESAKALTNLAIVQYQTRQYDPAQQNFQAAIEIIEDVEDRLNAQLVNPLKGLAAAQLEAGRPDLASETYGRAVHVTHVNEGPHNLDQLILLESLAETNLRLGEISQAREIQETIYALNARHYEFDSLALVPSLMRRAAWQHRAGLVYDSRATFRRAIRIIEKKTSKQDIRLIEPLILLGKSFFFVDLSGTSTYGQSSFSSGELYFKRAVRIATDSPDTTWQIVARANLALGDYYMFDNNPQRGRAVYKDVWELLSEEEARLDFRREALEQVVILRQRELPRYLPDSDSGGKPQTDNAILQGTVRMSYDVSTRGRAADVILVEAEPPEFTSMQKFMQREIRRRIFRPRFENAEVVASPDQELVHTYFYRQADLDAVRSSTAATAED
jgi:tetratricopeptide (TPR) repeat protein